MTPNIDHRELWGPYGKLLKSLRSPGWLTRQQPAQILQVPFMGRLDAN
jgi:hypothetical protein